MAEPLSAEQLTQWMAAASWPGARLERAPSRRFVSVRTRGAGVPRVARALELAVLPLPNSAQQIGDGHCYWQRPDEWLVSTTDAQFSARLARLEDAVGGGDGAVTDVSGSRVALVLSGSATRDVLASCIAVDLHPRTFAVGHVVQTLLAKAPVTLHLIDERPTWELLVRPSLVDYVVRWLVDAMDGVRGEIAQPSGPG